MRAHFRYLRYVIFHKLYVLRAGLAIRRVMGDVGGPGLVAWVWRLLVHDLSKFSRAEWSPYVASFYGPSEEAWIANRAEEWLDSSDTMDPIQAEAFARIDYANYKREVRADFNRAWLHHIHHNDHHWQHHVLLEDSGKTIVLVPPSWLVFEMVADWMAAGPKVHRAHSVAEAVKETIVWYARNHRQMQLREIVRQTVESILMELSNAYGITEAAADIRAVKDARVSLVIPGR